MAVAHLPAPVISRSARRHQSSPFSSLGSWRDIAKNGNQLIREPAFIVGRSGRVYSTLAEKQPEMIRIQPVDGSFRPKREKGVQRAVTGQELYALGYSPDDPGVKAAIANQTLSAATPKSGVASVVGAPTAGPVSQPALPAPVINPAAGSAATNQYQKQQDVYTAQQGQIDLATGPLTAASAAAAQASAQAIEMAKRAALEQDKALSASNAYLSTKEAANAAARAEEVGIQAAKQNTADIIATAQGQRYQDTRAYINQLLGLPAPTIANLPEGATTAGLPAGVTGAIKTQEQVLTEAAKSAGALRGFDVAASGIASERAGNAAQAAGNKAQLADLETRAAQLGVSVVGLSLDQAKLKIDQAQLELNKSQTPPPGMVKNDFTGEFVTPQQNAIINSQNAVVNDPTDPTGQTKVSQADLAARTQPDGNVFDKNGVLTDPKNPTNKLINGVWTDTATGNTFVNDVWHNPDGYVYLHGMWLPDIGWQNIGGTWWTTAGYQLQSDGTIRDPKTGKVQRFNGTSWIDITPRATGGSSQE